MIDVRPQRLDRVDVGARVGSAGGMRTMMMMSSRVEGVRGAAMASV